MQQTTINGHRERWTKRVSHPFPRWQLKTSLKSDPCITPVSLNLTSRRHFPDERVNSDSVQSQKEKVVADVRFRRWWLFRVRNRHVVSRFLWVEEGDKTSAREEKSDSVFQVHEMSTVNQFCLKSHCRFTRCLQWISLAWSHCRFTRCLQWISFAWSHTAGSRDVYSESVLPEVTLQVHEMSTVNQFCLKSHWALDTRFLLSSTSICWRYKYNQSTIIYL